MTTEHVDMNKINELVSVLGDAYDGLISKFLSSSDEAISKLEELCAVPDDNVEEIGRLAHSLKGTSGNVGAMSMHKYAAQLDKLAKENDLTVMPELLEEIKQSLDAYRMFVQKKAS